MKEIEFLKTENKSLKEKDVLVDKNIDDEFIEISPKKPIRVISLFRGGLTLKVNPDGSGKTFRFDKYGHTKPIAYSDLQDILSINRTLIEEGYVYICDKDVIKNNYLEEYYQKFLTKEQIDLILTFSDDDIKNMVENTTRTIQETIILNLVDKINNDEFVNRNKVDLIGDCCTPKCDIFGLALQKRVDK